MSARNSRRPHTVARRGPMEKNPDDWVTGNAPMTRAQASYLKILCEKTGEAFVARLTKAQASRRIDSMRTNTGRPLSRAS